MRKRRLAVGLLAGVLAIGGAAIGTPAHGAVRRQSPGGDKFAEGSWLLYFSARLDTISIQSAANGASAASVLGDGSFKVGHLGDATGTYKLEGTVAASTITRGASGEGDLALTAAEQPIVGANDEVSLSGQVTLSGTVHVTVGSFSVDTPINFAGPIGGSGDAPLMVERSNCNQAWGDWTLAVKESSSAAGNDTTGRGYWYAYRIVSLTTPEAMRFASDLSTFQTDVEQFSNAAVTAATFDVSQLESLVARAEALAAEIPTLEACNGLSVGGFYTSIMAGLVRQLIATMVAEGTKVPTDALLSLASAGYRSGAIGSGASDPMADDLESKLHDEIGDRLTTAISGHDIDTIIEIGTEAALNGWTDLSSRAAGAL